MINTSVSHPALRYNYWLGGKDHFQADRDAGDTIAAAFPHIRTAARENRAFLQRAVGWLTAEAGIRQFLDIGVGLPGANNVHEIAQRIAPQSRIVYVDNDPIVISHARALLNSSREGGTAYIEADVRNPEGILNDPAVRGTLDLSRPVALLLVAVLHYLSDDDDPHALVKRLVSALPAGSYLVLSHATYDPLDPETIARLSAATRNSDPPFCPRTETEVARFFDGLRLIEPGIVSLSDWRADPGPRPTAAEVAGYAAIARVGAPP